MTYLDNSTQGVWKIGTEAIAIPTKVENKQ